MNVVIAVHSNTGHTVNVARAFANDLRKAGHEVDVSMVRTRGEVHPGARNFALVKTPDLEGCDVLLVGGPVWAFSASPVIMAYVRSLEEFKGKTALPFVTMGLPWDFCGGTRAIGQMTEALVLLGARVLDGEIVHYLFGMNPQAVNAASGRIVKRLT